MQATSKIPIKPEIMFLNDRLKLFNLPLLDGGYMDQPYLHTEMLLVARQTIEVMEMIQQAANNK